jgi:aminoglycoside phosphotransferase (APT) family kinase protein
MQPHDGFTLSAKSAGNFTPVDLAILDSRVSQPTLVARLVASQFPQWAELPITTAEPDGWDNRSFRLGSELLVRLPSAEAYAAQVRKEHRWLPVLAPQLPLPIPVPLAMGEPADGYPWNWSVYRWLAGVPASIASIPDLTGLPVWVHGDVAAGNLLVRDGRLSAVIDFGSSGVGDPASDLMIAWTFCPWRAGRRFVRRIHLRPQPGREAVVGRCGRP